MISINNILEVEKYLGDIDVVVFDLDDTLYSEKEYIKSGFAEIEKCFPEMERISKKLWDSFENKEKPLDKYFFGEDKEKALSVYRNHFPDIHLYSGVREMLKSIKKNKKIGLITDGRPEGQRLKIEALKIENLFDAIIITDELGGIEYRKPNETAYKIMKKELDVEYNKMVYIGDNKSKDFIAPDKLGIQSIFFRNKDGLYSFGRSYE